MKTLRIVNGRRVTVEDQGQNVGYKVTFNSNTPGAVYTVSGIDFSSGQSAYLDNGNYTYTLRSNGYLTKSGSFVVNSNPLVVSDSLEVDPNYTAPVGFISVRSLPTGASISINNVSYGLTDSGTINLTTGTYIVKVTKSGYREYSQVVSVTAGSFLTINAEMISETPTAGSFIGDVCIGVNKYKRYANGQGGYYDVLVESNSSFCGYSPPAATKGSAYITSTSPNKEFNLMRVTPNGNVLVRSITPPTNVLELEPGEYFCQVPPRAAGIATYRTPYVRFAVSAGVVTNVQLEVATLELRDVSIPFRVATSTSSIGTAEISLIPDESFAGVQNSAKFLYIKFYGERGNGGEYWLERGSDRYISNVNYEGTAFVDLPPGAFIYRYRANMVDSYKGNSRCTTSFEHYTDIYTKVSCDSAIFFFADTYTYVRFDIILVIGVWSDGSLV